MSLENIIKHEPFNWNNYNGEPTRVWSEQGHHTNNGYHMPSVNMEFKDGTTYEFIDKAGYDSFRSDYPNHHRTLADFGNRDINKLSCGW